MDIEELVNRNGGEAIVFGEGWETHKCGKCLACNANPGVQAGKIIYRVLPKHDGIYIRLYVADALYKLLKDSYQRKCVGKWIEDGKNSGVEIVVQYVSDIVGKLNELYGAYQKDLRG